MVDKALQGIEKELKDIKTSLEKLVKQAKVTEAEITPLQDKLRDIDNKQVGGKFLVSFVLYIKLIHYPNIIYV